MGKVYRTAQGRELDIEKVRLQNELVPALGNMKVNARGDQLGPGGRIIKTREQIMNDHYKTKAPANVVRPDDDAIPTRSPRKNDDAIPTSSKRAAQEFNPGTVSADPPAKSEQQTAEEQTGLKGGLARAVKRAQDGTEKKGLKRI